MDIPFETFTSLIYRLSHPPTTHRHLNPLSPGQIFTSWLNHLPRPFPPGTGKHLFRLLFPHEGSRRRYGLKETKLASELERILRVTGLSRWDAVGWGQGGTGCLGKEVEKVIRGRANDEEDLISAISIGEVDKLLDMLAAHSAFSQLSQPPSALPTPTELLTKLYRDSALSPSSLALITQIILRDLRPLLNPLPSLSVSNPTAMLRLKSNTGPAQLELHTAMKCWDFRMADMYRKGRGDLDSCADEVERMGQGSSSSVGPVVGVNVQIPKCQKGRSVEDALKEFTGTARSRAAGSVWAETKYDGYRMQVHVEVRSSHDVRLSVFSKSKRESTVDRLNTHAIIHSALGLPVPEHLPAHPRLASRAKTCTHLQTSPRSIILDAEVVPYNEGQRDGDRGPGVEEFWWLGPSGVTADGNDLRFRADQNRHLCLFFYDILCLNGENLLDKPLSYRRQLLEENVRVIPGFSEMAAYTVIPLSNGKRHASEALRSAFSRSSERREEGLVLKAPESRYLDSRWRWVKLKKDYIPNLGDCIDLVLLGAGWDADRARDLRVDTSVFTSFYLGVLTNHMAVRAKLETPHFEILFKVSYGLDRDVLETVNSSIRHGRWRTKSYDKDDRFKRRLIGLSWTHIMRRDISAPSVLFEQPMCVEVMGAGFQKIPMSKHYELRWPRLQKIYDVKERSWTEALTSFELIRAARQSLGYEIAGNMSTASPKDDSIKTLWRSSSAANLTDIPELPTPSPERPALGRRMQSAPNLGEILKQSPPTPVSTRLRQVPGVMERLFDDCSPTAAVPDEAPEVETGLELLEYISSPSRKGFKDRPGQVRGKMIVAPLQTLAQRLLGDSGLGRKRKRVNAVRPLSLRTRIRKAIHAEPGRCVGVSA